MRNVMPQHCERDADGEEGKEQELRRKMGTFYQRLLEGLVGRYGR